MELPPFDSKAALHSILRLFDRALTEASKAESNAPNLVVKAPKSQASLRQLLDVWVRIEEASQHPDASADLLKQVHWVATKGPDALETLKRYSGSSLSAKNWELLELAATVPAIQETLLSEVGPCAKEAVQDVVEGLGPMCKQDVANSEESPIEQFDYWLCAKHNRDQLLAGLPKQVADFLNVHIKRGTEQAKVLEGMQGLWPEHLLVATDLLSYNWLMDREYWWLRRYTDPAVVQLLRAIEWLLRPAEKLAGQPGWHGKCRGKTVGGAWCTKDGKVDYGGMCSTHKHMWVAEQQMHRNDQIGLYRHLKTEPRHNHPGNGWDEPGCPKCISHRRYEEERLAWEQRRLAGCIEEARDELKAERMLKMITYEGADWIDKDVQQIAQQIAQDAEDGSDVEGVDFPASAEAEPATEQTAGSVSDDEDDDDDGRFEEILEQLRAQRPQIECDPPQDDGRHLVLAVQNETDGPTAMLSENDPDYEPGRWNYDDERREYWNRARLEYFNKAKEEEKRQERVENLQAWKLLHAERQVKGSTAVQSASLVPSTPLPGQTGSLSHAPLGPGGGHKNAETSLVVYGLGGAEQLYSPKGETPKRRSISQADAKADKENQAPTAAEQGSGCGAGAHDLSAGQGGPPRPPVPEQGPRISSTRGNAVASPGPPGGAGPSTSHGAARKRLRSSSPNAETLACRKNSQTSSANTEYQPPNAVRPQRSTLPTSEIQLQVLARYLQLASADGASADGAVSFEAFMDGVPRDMVEPSKRTGKPVLTRDVTGALTRLTTYGWLDKNPGNKQGRKVTPKAVAAHASIMAAVQAAG